MPEPIQPGATTLWAAVACWVEASLGLHFPPRLGPDLERGMGAAARRLGLSGATACAQRMLAHQLSEEQQQVVAECLTISETYFFRDAALLERLATHVLQPLIAARRQGSRHLRLWSAGCSSGEEPYSLAMLVASMVPDWRDWNISILGTDLNAAALRKARAGAYSAWSLRGSVPEQCRPFLQPGCDGLHHVDPQLRRKVRFAPLNLARDDYPTTASMTTAMDLVLCRNVLIYFEPARVRAVLARFGRSLVDDGWLVTGSVEVPAVAVPGLTVVREGGLFALRRSQAVPAATAMRAAATLPPRPGPPGAKLGSAQLTVSLQKPAMPSPPVASPIGWGDARHPSYAATPLASAEPSAEPSAAPAAPLAQQARQHADAGDLEGAERLCRQAIAQDKLDPDATYLLASILSEGGAIDEAMVALHRTLYLDPGHLLARFVLGGLALRQGHVQPAHRHFSRTLARLDRVPAEEVLAGGGGLTAGELEDVIRRTDADGP